MRVAFYDDPLFGAHDAGEGHPERPERLDAVRRGLQLSGCESQIMPRRPRPATREELLRVHTTSHVDGVASTQGHSVRFDADTQAGPRSYEAALLAAGAVADAVDRVLDGELDRAFCAVRPPGHHAEADRVMGFCLFNNVAVGAAHALARGLERVLIVDFDVHHGNGTQHIFYRDPRVLYVSSHAFPFYPGTGGLDEVGEGAGRGFTVNLPLPSGCGDREYAVLYRDLVRPVGCAFRPQLVLVSAGFDPHDADPLAGMRVTDVGFGTLMRRCLETADDAGGRCIVALEGGYDLPAIVASMAAVTRELVGQKGEEDERPRTPLADAILRSHSRALAPFWPILSA